jgi:predicted TIM-barrel fold metal-dependent hydrolase
LRLQDLDRDGHDAQVIYTLPFPLLGTDRTLDMAVIRAYNDALAEFQSACPERLIPMALLPWWDADEAAGEVRRVAPLGFRGVQFDPFHSVESVDHSMWEPMWAAAVETDLTVSIHEGGWRQPRKITPPAAAGPLTTLGSDEIIAGVLYSGVLERYPTLRVVFGEVGLGWIVWLMERFDNVCSRTPTSLANFGLSHMPSELWRRQCALTFTGERNGLHSLCELGEETAMWAADYPHSSSTWPNSEKYLRENVFELLDQPAQRKVLCENAMRMYKLQDG